MMQVNTGRLVSGEEMERIRRRDAELAATFTEVPQALSRAAAKKLAGAQAAMVALHSGGKLSRWAAHERAKASTAKRRAAAKRRKKRATEKATRKAQRRS
jgi:hypothetical protein